ncbi:glycosyltransferase [Priestia megaterium]|uniref:glycosyltransferase n=1 Tax=Priestia megaterium TaxID=1404 RepID=UPI00203D731F|nr:glycosyltransferase [Priestia megaterium]MCM3181932.1 glycosyltransferase [Priestia megaterium]
MKILFVVGQFPKLSETFILNQITGLIDQGHQVDILAEKPTFQENAHEDVHKYNLIDRTYYYDFPNSKKDKLEILFKATLKYPIKVLQMLNFRKFGKEVFSLRQIMVLEAMQNKQLNYDVIHCHFGPNGILAAILKDLNLLKGKISTTFHGYDMTTYLKDRGDNVYDFLFKSGDAFLPISNFWAEKLKSLGCESSKISVHPMGVSLEKFKAVKPAGNSKIKLLSVARLVEKKGIQFSIEAVCRLIEQGYDVEYNIVGDGPLKPSLNTQIGNLNDKIKFLGWKTQEETVKLIEESDIFLVPSVTSENGDMEGIPVVLMEAMAMQKPVISTYHSGIPELITSNSDGLLVPEKDVDALYDELENLIKDSNRSEDIGIAARKTIQSKHDINMLNIKLIDSFKGLYN